MKALLIWELVPEDTHVYMLDNLTQEEFDKLCACHNWYINLVDWEDNQDNLNWLSEFLLGKEAIQLVRGEPLKNVSVDAVVHSGFLL